MQNQPTCPLYSVCRYPRTRARFFEAGEVSCSQGDRCEIEIAVNEPSILRTLDQAEQVERNVTRGLPWNCGCELCQKDWTQCYQQNGPDKELRSMIRDSGYTPPWRNVCAQ